MHERPLQLVLIFLLSLAATAAPVAAQPLDRLTIVAPAAPGGGWDQTARAMQRALEAEGLVRAVQVENVPGAAGTVGLAQFVNDPPRSEPALLVTGLVMVGAIVFNDAPVSLAQTTPIAALTGEYEVVVVPAASPIRTMADLIERLRAAPASVSWAGGSAGGTDHILAGLIASAAGVDPARVNYIAFSGGGEAAAAVLGGQVTAAISGYSEFAPHLESGAVRAVAISAPAPQPGIKARPLSEQGLDISLSNWRGVVAPPGIDEALRQRLTSAIEAMVRSQTWQHTLRERGWSDQFLNGDEFTRFVDVERQRVTRIARSLRTSESPRDGHSRLYPWLVLLGALAAIGSLVFEYRRPDAAPARQPTPRSDYRTVALTLAALGLYLAALATAGFVIASALLFWTVTVSFDRRRWLRDGAIALLLAIAIYAGFAAGLGVSLPAGWLGRWIR